QIHVQSRGEEADVRGADNQWIHVFYNSTARPKEPRQYTGVSPETDWRLGDTGQSREPLHLERQSIGRTTLSSSRRCDDPGFRRHLLQDSRLAQIRALVLFPESG